MPPRSQVVTMLPAYLRQEIERRLFQNGFRDYEGLAKWVRDQGYNISDDSLWRYGRSLQQEIHAARVSALQAAALADLPDARGAIAQTLVTIAQQKALEALLDQEELKPALLNALARLMTTAQAISTAAAAPASSVRAASSDPPAAGNPEPVTAPAANASRALATAPSQIQSPQTTARFTAVAPPPDARGAATLQAGAESLRVSDPQTPKAAVSADAGLLPDSNAATIEAASSEEIESTTLEVSSPNQRETAVDLAPAVRTTPCRAQPRAALRGRAAETCPDARRRFYRIRRASPRIATVLADAANYIRCRVAIPNPSTDLQPLRIAGAIP
jgi:hypothetical protein